MTIELDVTGDASAVAGYPVTRYRVAGYPVTRYPVARYLYRATSLSETLWWGPRLVIQTR
jgi:hypothetical protein